MKNIKDIISEKLKVNGNTPATVKEKLEYALPELEAELAKILKVNKSFNFGLKINEYKKRDGSVYYNIESDNLIELTGEIGKITYEYFIFNTWGGTSSSEKPNKIWINPKWAFKYKAGGSNGSDAIWNSIWFDTDTLEWEFGNLV